MNFCLKDIFCDNKNRHLEFFWQKKVSSLEVRKFFERLKCLPGQLDRRLGSEIGNLRHISEKVSARIGGRLGLATLSHSFSLFLTHTLSLFEHPILSLSLALILASLLDLHPIMIVLSHLALPVLSASSLSLPHALTHALTRTCTHSHVAEKNTSDVFKCTHSLAPLWRCGGCPCFKSHRFQSFASQSLLRHALTL